MIFFRSHPFHEMIKNHPSVEADVYSFLFESILKTQLSKSNRKINRK